MRPSSQSANIFAIENDKNPRHETGDGGFVQVRAFSKINLFLEVLERRADDYHNLRTVMQSLDLHDTITIQTQHTAPGEASRCFFKCNSPTLPLDERNIVTRAVRYMLQKFDIPPCHIHVDIKKRIPIAAGLGGGSSDCAATLIGMSEIFRLQLTPNILRKIGLKFGADVPFCVEGGTKLAEGVGEKLTDLAPHPPCFIVLACLPIPVSTAEIFNEYAALRASGQADRCISRIIHPADFSTLPRIVSHMHNDLAQVTVKKHPEVAQLIAQMKALGALNAMMSGSGPSVFGYFETEAAAQKAADTLKQTITDVFITQPKG